jgi:phosphohistidine phosphatase
MNIYLIRHGESESSSANKRDYERELTHRGRTITRQVAFLWKRVIPGFDYIISSPLKRAVQTAQIIADVFKSANGVITDEKLSSGSRTEDIIEIIQAYKADNIALVGHQPDLAEHLANLVSTSGIYTEFKKSSIAKISFGLKIKMGKGTLEFLIPPDFANPAE